MSEKNLYRVRYECEGKKLDYIVASPDVKVVKSHILQSLKVNVTKASSDEVFGYMKGGESVVELEAPVQRTLEPAE